MVDNENKFQGVMLMFFTKLIVDLIIVIAVMAAVPKLMTTLIDLARKLANGLNDGLRKLFRLDGPKWEETRTSGSEKDKKEYFY